MSRAYTEGEAVEAFLSAVKDRARYWANLPDYEPILGRNRTVQERCEGVAFSIMTLIDGCADMPAMDLVLRPHPDDKQYNIEEGNNYYEGGMVINAHVHLHDYRNGE